MFGSLEVPTCRSLFGEIELGGVSTRLRDSLHMVAKILDRRPPNRSDATTEAAAVSRLTAPSNRSSSPSANT